MGNPKDFLAKQIRTNTLILSGGNWARDQYGGTPGLLIYSASDATDYVGGRPDKFASGSNKFGMVQIYQTDISPSGGFALSNRYGDNLRIHFEKPVLPHNTTYRRGVVSFSISSGSKHHPAITILSGTANSQGCRVFILSQSINGDANTKTDNSVNNPYRMKDVNFWVSGSKGSKVSSGPGYAGNGDYGTAVFGGDLVVSGTLYAEKQVIEVDISQSGSLFVSGSAEIGGGLIVNEHGGQELVVFRNRNSNNFLFFKPGAGSGAGRLGVGNYDWTNSNVADCTFHIADTDSSTNAPVELLRLTKESSGTPAAGLGVKIGFEVETTAGNEILGSLEVISTDVGSGAEDGAFVFKTMTAGATNTEKFRIGADETVVNEGSDDHDFRVEGNGATATSLFHVNAGTDSVLIKGATADDTLLFTIQGNNDAGNNNSSNLLSVSPTQVVINEDSQDVDFRVESTNNANAIFVNAGTDQVLILTGAAGAGDKTGAEMTDANFVVSGSISKRGVGGTYGTSVFGGDVHSSGSITADGGVGGWTDGGSFVYPTSGEHVVIGGASVGAADIYLGGDGAAVFNEQGVNVDFRIEGENDQNLFVVDASADSIGINVAAASHGARLDILANDASELGLLVTNDPPEGSAVGDVMKCISGSSEVFSVGSTDVVVNEGGTARDFRVESDNQTNMLYVDGTNNVVGIGTSSPDANAPLHVTHPQNNGTALLLIENESSNAIDAQLSFALNGTFTHTIGVDDSDSDKLKITLGSTLGASNKALVDFPSTLGSSIVVNEDGQNNDFRIEGENDSNLFTIDASNDSIGINVAAGKHGARLDILANDPAEVGLIISGSATKNYAIGDLLRVTSGTFEVFSIGGNDGDVVINEGGTTRDFRVESDNQTNMLFVDGTNNVVAVGTSSPDTSSTLHIAHPQDNAKTILMIENESAGSDYDAQISFVKNGTVTHAIGMDDSDSDKLKISLQGVLGASNKALMDFPSAAGSAIVINEDGQDHDFRVETSGDDKALFIDGGTDNVGIGVTPSFKLDIADTSNPIARFAHTAASSAGGIIRLENTRNGGNGAAGDFPGGVQFYAPDSAGNTTQYAKVFSKIISPTDGSEVGSLIFETVVGANSNKGTPLYLQNDRVHILSGGAGVSYDESSGTDVAFFVSGSQNSRGTSERGTAVFGGDVVISGSIFTSGSVRIDKSYGKMQVLDSSDNIEGTAAANLPGDIFKLKEGTGIAMSINAGGDTITLSTNVAGTNSTPIFTDRGFQSGWALNHQGTSVICTSSIAFVSGNHIGGVSPTAYDATNVGADVFFFVSGSVGGVAASVANRHGVSVFGGDMIISGALATKSTFKVNGAANFKGDVFLGNATSDTVTFNARVASHVLPSADSTYNLGSAGLRFANIYTGDLHLRNDRGNWTIYEEPDMLVVVNNLTGKKYKMGLTPLEDDE